jgi:hypothetical protein
VYIEDFVFFGRSASGKVPAKGTLKNDLEMKIEFRLFCEGCVVRTPRSAQHACLFHVMTLNFPYPALVAGYWIYRSDGGSGFFWEGPRTSFLFVTMSDYGDVDDAALAAYMEGFEEADFIPGMF